jgi:hypothetical protein
MLIARHASGYRNELAAGVGEPNRPADRPIVLWQVKSK